MEKKEEKIEKNTNINELDALLLIEQVVFGLNNENFNQYVKYIISQFDEIHTSSFNLLLIQMMYLNFSVKMSDPKTYFNLIKQISKYHISLNKEKKTSIYVMFLIFLCIKDTQASHYLLYYMVESHFINPKITQKNKFKSLPIFAHYNSIEDIKKFFYVKFMNQIIYNYEELSNNGWELHKKFIEEGHNPNEIAKIIRNDEIEKLQEISSQNNFDFNQIIEPSLYERCSFINEENVSLIDYAAFFSSIKCFKYLLMNNANVKNAGKYAVAGGNIEIIHLCEQNHSTFDDAYETTIKFHKNEIFYYLYENNFPDSTNLVKLGKFCVLYHNYEIFTFLLKEGMEVNDDIINESARNGNLYLTRYFCKKYQIPKNILIFSSESNNNELFIYTLKQKGVDINAKDQDGNTAFILETSKGYIEIVKLLLEQEGIDINAKNKNENTAHILASLNGHTEIVKLLLEQKGIDINAKSENGETALILASSKGHTEIVKLLLEQEGIDINAKNKYRNDLN